MIQERVFAFVFTGLRSVGKSDSQCGRQIGWAAALAKRFRRIRGQPAGRFRKCKEMKKFSVRLVNGPEQICRGNTAAYLHLQKWL